jgi:hypothetical protein
MRTDAQHYTQFQQILQLEGARVKLKGYHANKMWQLGMQA